jgi:hypothetical protein
MVSFGGSNKFEAATVLSESNFGGRLPASKSKPLVSSACLFDAVTGVDVTCGRSFAPSSSATLKPSVL